jgi:hypothetical protein
VETHGRAVSTTFEAVDAAGAVTWTGTRVDWSSARIRNCMRLRRFHASDDARKFGRDGRSPLKMLDHG